MKRAYCKSTLGGHVPHMYVKDVIVPEGETIQAGAVVQLEEFSTDIDRNYLTFDGVAPADVTKNVIGLVINDGFETLADGRRPRGQSDYTQYEFVGGDVVPTIMITEGMPFEISDEALAENVVPVVGQYLVPVNGEYQLTSATDLTGVKFGLKVLAKKHIRAGGNGGAGFIPTSIVMAVRA